MKKIITFILGLVVLGVVQASHAAAYQRIVSLKPNITEIVFAVGAGNKVVGVTKYCDYPPEVKKIPKVGDYTRPYLEPLIALRPDLVITSKEESSRKAIEELERMGIKVAVFPFTTMSQTLNSIRQIAKLVGEKQKGEQVVKEMEFRLDKLQKRYGGRKKQRVLIVWGKKPLIVGGKGTYVDDLLHIVGAENVVPAGSMAYPRWSAENVIASNPDVIIDLSMGTEEYDNSDPQDAHVFWNRLSTVRAVKDNKVFFMNSSVLGRASPRVCAGLEKLGAMIHPCKCKQVRMK